MNISNLASRVCAMWCHLKGSRRNQCRHAHVNPSKRQIQVGKHTSGGNLDGQSYQVYHRHTKIHTGTEEAKTKTIAVIQVRACISQAQIDEPKPRGWRGGWQRRPCTDILATMTLLRVASSARLRHWAHTDTKSPDQNQAQGTIFDHGYSRSSGILKLHTNSSYPCGFERSQSRRPVG